MRIVNVNPLIKTRVKDMVLTLLPDVGYVKVSNSGLVTMKRKWWSIRKVQSTVTDMVVGVLPQKISEFSLAERGRGYQRVFNEHIAALMSLRSYNPQFDVCNYVWEQYVKYCVEVPTIIVNTNNEIKILEKKNYLPIAFRISPKSIRSITELIQEDPKSRQQQKFIKKLNSFRDNLPTPVVKWRIFAFS
jgi:hypothetical protein